MPPTYAPSAVIPQLTAAEALTQLNRRAVFARAARGDYEASAFEKSDTVTIRRARIVQSQDYDPRSGVPAATQEAGYVSATLTLERLFTAGFPVYSHDNKQARSKYVREYGEQIGSAIATSSDDYLYSKFRTLNIAASGAVAYGAHPPLSIVAADVNGELGDFNKNVLIAAGTVQNQNEVAANDRFAILSSAAAGSFLGDAVLVEGFVATSAGSSQLLQNGMAPGVFVPRYGFMAGSSNAVGSQAGVFDLDTGAGAQLTLPIGSVTPNALFTAADYAASTSLGTLDLTLTVTGALQNVAVGQICRLGTVNKTTAYGVILRVIANVVTIVPFSVKGTKLVAAQINLASDLFSVPTIGSISVAYQREALLFATRLIAAPSENSGASMTTMADANSGLGLQIIQGGYKVDEFKESQRYATLMGSLLSDHRKAVLILSN